jgi:hypothetical protein
MFKANTIELRDGQPSFPLGTRVVNASLRVLLTDHWRHTRFCMLVRRSLANLSDAKLRGISLVELG